MGKLIGSVALSPKDDSSMRLDSCHNSNHLFNRLERIAEEYVYLITSSNILDDFQVHRVEGLAFAWSIVDLNTIFVEH